MICPNCGFEIKLTPRQAEIMELLKTGLTSKEIGSRMGITAGDVRTRLCEIYQRLGVKNGNEAIYEYYNKPNKRDIDQPQNRRMI